MGWCESALCVPSRVIAWLFIIYVGFPVHGYDNPHDFTNALNPTSRDGLLFVGYHLGRHQVLPSMPWFQPISWGWCNPFPGTNHHWQGHPPAQWPASQLPGIACVPRHHTADLTTKQWPELTYHHRPIVNDPHRMTSPRQYNARTRMTPAVLPRPTKQLGPPRPRQIPFSSNEHRSHDEPSSLKRSQL